MLRQYAPPRFRYETIRGRTLPVGTVPVGEIFRYAPSRGLGRAPTWWRRG